MKPPAAILDFALLALLGLFAACNVFAATVPLAWTPSPDGDAAGYRIYYGGASGVYTNTITAGNVTNTVVAGLADGTVYYFAATTVSTNGTESGFSNEFSVRTPRPPLKLFHK